MAIRTKGKTLVYFFTSSAFAAFCTRFIVRVQEELVGYFSCFMQRKYAAALGKKGTQLSSNFQPIQRHYAD